MKLPKILPVPNKPKQLSNDAKWLAGEGAGSWFELKRQSGGQLAVTRYSPVGVLECDVVFEFPEELELIKEYALGYPSHCATLTIYQGSNTFTVNAITEM